MSEAVEINGVKYKMNREPDTITLQRYNKTHKMWVNLHLPTNNQKEGKAIESKIVDILSNQYIERTAKAQIMATTRELLAYATEVVT